MVGLSDINGYNQDKALIRQIFVLTPRQANRATTPSTLQLQKTNVLTPFNSLTPLTPNVEKVKRWPTSLKGKKLKSIWLNSLTP